ncbi:protoporphyrinogen oxidase [Halohasta salina]|uniref:protoporphyrinogen oxidase n=1 Tax=Halohasta salina TaxID=2961621 RepID=UPI0020A3571C|nr:protoporphyrinogen oxidase [Halohasta salina]
MRVGVVGAGISGLSTVHELAAREAEVVAFEAREEPGGIVRSWRMNGHLVELGPQRLRLTPGIESLVDELDLREELRFGDDDQPLYIYHDGQLRVVPLSVREAITTDLISPLGKLRILAEPLTGPAREGETVDDFLVRRFGKQAARRYMGPLYSGLYGTDPREMLMEYSLGRALDSAGVDRSLLVWVLRRLIDGRETPPICTFEEGLGTLTTALYEAHADAISLDTPVTAIEPAGEGYDLQTDTGTEHVDEVVVTTPAATSADLLDPVDSDLAATLRRFNYNPIAMVFLESDYDREGIGALVPSGGELPISGSTWNASFLHREGLFTCYVDPNSYPAMPESTDEELGQVAAEAFEELSGASATPIGVHRWDPGMPAYDGSWTAMDDLSTPDGIHFCTNFVGRAGIPGRIRSAKGIVGSILGD